MRKDNKPVENKLAILNLATGEQTVIDSIQGYFFSPDGTWLAMRHYPPEAAGATGGGGRGAGGGGRGGGGRGGGSNGADDNTPGATLILRELATGRDLTFGNVSEVMWQDMKHRGTLLAMAISTPDKAGNGIQVFDTQTGNIRVLDSSASTYSNLVWRKNTAELAALKSKTDDKHDGPAYIALAWKDAAKAGPGEVYDPTADKQFPAGKRTVNFRRPTWSEDGATLFIGVAEWYPKPARGKRGDDAAADTADEQPTVDVWHWRDPEVMAYQVKNATQDGRKNMLAAWHIDTGAFTLLGHDLTTEQVTPIKHTNLAYRRPGMERLRPRALHRPALREHLFGRLVHRTTYPG
jgi:hypothetical protein